MWNWIIIIHLEINLKVKWKSLIHVWLFATSPGQNTGVGSLSLLQGIFPTQESTWGLLHCRWILYQPSYQGSPRILEWVAYPFSRGSSWPRNWTQVPWIAGGFFTNWALREASCQKKTRFKNECDLFPHRIFVPLISLTRMKGHVDQGM